MVKPGIWSLAVAALCIVGVRAELPPGSYDKLKIDAQEAVIIKVTDVKTTKTDSGREVIAEAEVLTVQRTKNGLDKGKKITISYFARDKPMPGARPVAVLLKGDIYPAFLNKGEKNYEPAAHGESFNLTPDQ